MVKEGVVLAKEGKDGGYSLAVDPQSVSVKYLFNILGESFSLAKCLHGDHVCFDQKKCKMKPIWSKIKKIIDQELDGLTLKDLI